MQSKATTVNDYLKELPPERREAIEKVRSAILNNLPKGYEEGMQYGMISYYVPLSIYPNGYRNDKKTPLPYISLASQKNHMAVYCMCMYGNEGLEKWFKEAYQGTGNKLDMGKGCVRFVDIEKFPVALIGELVKKTSVSEFIKIYEAARGDKK